MKKVPPLALTAALLGCGVSTSASLMDPSLHLARTCPAAVKLYTTPERVKTEYREVALLNSTGLTRYSDEGDMIDSMREKAAKIGANGIILSGIDEPSAALKVAAEAANVLSGEAMAVSPERKGRALAIFVAADSAETRTACAQSK